MIAFIAGTVRVLSHGSIVIDTGGVGVELVPTSRCLAGLALGERVTVPSCLVVREDSWTLFGFADADERACFQALQAAKGVGPRVAVNLLGALTPDQLRSAVAAGDATALTAAPGIGAKGAQRLVLDLRDRLGPATGATAVASPLPSAPAGGWQRDVQMALVGLGWTAPDAAAAVSRVATQIGGDGVVAESDGSPDTAKLLRLALQSLDRTAEAR